MQDITKLKTILKNFIERFTTQAKREKNHFTNNDWYTLINVWL